MGERLDKKQQSNKRKNSKKSREDDPLFRTMTATEWGKLQEYLDQQQKEEKPSKETKKESRLSLSFTDLPIAQAQPKHVVTPSSMQLPSSEAPLPSSKEFSHNHLHNKTPQLLGENDIIKGSYRLTKRIADSRSGKLFEAEHTRFGGRVLIKVLHSSITQNATMMSAYIRAIRALEKLTDPTFVKAQLLDFDQQTQSTYYFMEPIEGMSLTQALQMRRHRHEGQPPFTSEELLDFLEKLITPLQKAHDKQAFCCNLHPSHILRTQSKDTPIRILNFGFPILSGSTDNPMATIAEANDLFYVAPEVRAAGQPITAATDVFSLGVILYQMLTGNLPVGIAQPPSRLFPTWSSAIDEVVSKATQGNWQDRFQSVEALFAKLQKALRPTQTTGSRLRATITPTGSHPSRPRSTSRDDLRHPPRPQTPPQRVGARSSAERPSVTQRLTGERPTIGRRTTTRPLHVDEIGIGTRGTRPHRTTSANSLPRVPNTPRRPTTSQSHMPSPPRRPTTSQAHMPSVPRSARTSPQAPIRKRPFEQPIMTWDAHSTNITSAALSPDGRFLASASEDGNLKVWATSNWSLLYSMEFSSTQLFGLQWCLKSRYLAFIKNVNQLDIWDSQSQQSGHTFETDSPICRITWNPNSHHVYTGLENGTIAIWHLALGRQSGQLNGHKSQINAMLFAPNQDWLLSSSLDRYTHIWHVTQKKLHKQFCFTESCGTALALHPSQKKLAIGHENGQLTSYTFPQGAQEQLLQEKQQSKITQLAYTPSGRSLISASESGQIDVWDVLSGQRRHSIHYHQSKIDALGIHPTGQWMFASDQGTKLTVWDVSTV